MRSLSRTLPIGASIVAVIALAAGAIAHTGATGVVKERMAAMKSIGASMKSLNAMMRGRESYDPERVRALALSIEGHGGDAMTKLFPDNSLQHPTEARPGIWSDWNRFSAIAQQLAEYASALAAAAENPRSGTGGPDMMQGGSGNGRTPEMLAKMPPEAAFRHLTRTCVACHDDFRKKN